MCSFLDNYDELWKWSTEENEMFWEEFFHFSKMKYSKPYAKVRIHILKSTLKDA